MFHHFPLLERGACSHLNILIFFDPYLIFLDPRFKFLSEPPRILRGLSIPIKILRTLHARTEEPQTLRRLSIPSKILRTLHARASGHAALRTGVGPWENEALVWGLFTFEYFDLLLILILIFC